MISWQKSLLCVLIIGAALSTVNGDWERINGGLKHVTASVNYLWGVNSADNIYRCSRPCTGSNWIRVPGGLKQIDASDEEVWGVNSANQI